MDDLCGKKKSYTELESHRRKLILDFIKNKKESRADQLLYQSIRSLIIIRKRKETEYDGNADQSPASGSSSLG